MRFSTEKTPFIERYFSGKEELIFIDGIRYKNNYILVSDHLSSVKANCSLSCEMFSPETCSHAAAVSERYLGVLLWLPVDFQ